MKIAFRVILILGVTISVGMYTEPRFRFATVLYNDLNASSYIVRNKYDMNKHHEFRFGITQEEYAELLAVLDGFENISIFNSRLHYVSLVTAKNSSSIAVVQAEGECRGAVLIDENKLVCDENAYISVSEKLSQYIEEKWVFRYPISLLENIRSGGDH